MDVVAIQYRPPAPLDGFVDRMWFYDAPPRPFAKERMMPTGAATLVVNLMEDETRNYSAKDPSIMLRLRGSSFSGPNSVPFVIDTLEQTSVMGIEFHPGGSWPFFPCAADELVNRHISLKDLWGGHAESLRAQLLSAATPRDKFAVFEQALVSLAARPVELDGCVDHAVRKLTASAQICTVAELGNRMSISQRRFSRLFAQQVGFKPKTFARIQRFQRVLKQIGLGREVDWASVVAQSGYYDQAHFIHDFRSFSGFTPNEYAARSKIDLRHVPLD